MDHWNWLRIAMDTETLPARSAVLRNSQLILCKTEELKCKWLFQTPIDKGYTHSASTNLLSDNRGPQLRVPAM
ncbi:hypothetical protein GDO81_015062 [Engystomops pustulosus]|uniref:Growth hormone receptor n=1 Tax=Engystomops pustulosus TaxID=76066 RepID=A0AAV7AHH7_ENGPU|nr:hypothetical protein GDO81_015062 [Engystomops pustulosus]